jgi:hypothetical protein
MDDAMILLVLRGLAALSLLAFMGLVAYFLHRDAGFAVQTRARPAGRLVVLTNDTPPPEPGARLPLAPATTLGRAPGNTIQLDDAYASNEHARLVQRMGQWWLEDRHSSNGTQLNGMPVTEPIVMSSGDIISIGSVQLRLELE